ncbi:MBL fold metallo-hydrolase [Chloroflexota bacterium]
MANCIILPIPLYATDGDKSRFTYGRNMGQPLTVVSYSWYIEGLKEKILVDAGGNVEYPVKVRGMQLHEIQSLDSGLKRLGIDFQDIDLVILTHLHYDHVSQGSRFANVRFIVQRDELEYARNPHPLFTTAYHEEFLANCHRPE